MLIPFYKWLISPLSTSLPIRVLSLIALLNCSSVHNSWVGRSFILEFTLIGDSQILRKEVAKWSDCSDVNSGAFRFSSEISFSQVNSCLCCKWTHARWARLPDTPSTSICSVSCERKSMIDLIVEARSSWSFSIFTLIYFQRKKALIALEEGIKTDWKICSLT